MGDFVVTGGEIPAMAVTDAICRMVPGVLPEEECFTEESHWAGLLEYPQYSRPDEWHGRRVPDVLLSGHHENVAKWRKKESYKRTMLRRPDHLGDNLTKSSSRRRAKKRSSLRQRPKPRPSAPRRRRRRRSDTATLSNSSHFCRQATVNRLHLPPAGGKNRRGGARVRVCGNGAVSTVS